MDSSSLTKTKNWSSRNEVTETSGRLHPLWPQLKWLHTPWTRDYRHTRQDRRIQTELAITLAKNATKPNPFEIIPLQTTRKENIWKTEEALARAAVTVVTERIEWSNPWCLWWWTLTWHSIFQLLREALLNIRALRDVILCRVGNGSTDGELLIMPTDGRWDLTRGFKGYWQHCWASGPPKCCQNNPLCEYSAIDGG